MDAEQFTHLESRSAPESRVVKARKNEKHMRVRLDHAKTIAKDAGQAANGYAWAAAYRHDVTILLDALDALSPGGPVPETQP